MTVRVSFPTLFSDRIGGVGSVELEGDTVGAVLRSLSQQYPDLAPLVWQDDDTPNPVLVVFLNERQIPGGSLDLPVASGDELTLVPAIEGGATRVPGSQGPRVRGGASLDSARPSIRPDRCRPAARSRS